MIEIESLSKIGFGGYRINQSDEDHRKSLIRAIEKGCNLIDTASNYTNGESERLIGEVAGHNPEIFIITKAGYIQSNFDHVEKLSLKHGFKKHIFKSDRFWHCIHPEYLSSQIQQSLVRLKRTYLDCFLLHNPEYQLRNYSKKRVYKRIMLAFGFLEQMVSEGKIRYYGISSNTLALEAGNLSTLSLLELVKIAKKISKTNHFKFIQFPYNVVENDAAYKIHTSNKTLVELAKDNSIVTIGNRAISTKWKDGATRLATYHDELENINFEKDELIFQKIIEAVTLQLTENNFTEKWENFTVLKHLSENWSRIGNPEAVDIIFDNHLLLFLNSLYQEKLPPDLVKLLGKFKDLMLLYSKRNITNLTKEILTSRNVEIIGNKSISKTLCASYISGEIDCSLVGMRKEKYVDDLSSLFTKRLN